eukprot:TRINITY_DN37885_c0_g1_i1.p1 TRINITY_DN37885_c0_g1~~TRINITY_DN37885_c0_g1_i1.p1  ORF type:complete len:425 (+),score=76.00 TRINITY_DN37885_c0_g1_i1:50-1276(+)
MIHVFNACKELCLLPCKCCEALSKCCDECGPHLEQLCLPCSAACGKCSETLTDFMNKPLGGYVFMAAWMSCLEIGMCLYTIQYSDDLLHCKLEEGFPKDVGMLNWLYAQTGFGLLHLAFGFYVQCRLVSKLQEMSEQSELVGHTIVTQKKLQEAFEEIFLRDIGVCLYVFLLGGSFFWSDRGSRWSVTSPECNPGEMPSRAASFGLFFFWFVILYSIGWYSYIKCLASNESLILKRAVTVVGTAATGSFLPPKEAAERVDSPSPAPAAAEGGGGMLGKLFGGAGAAADAPKPTPVVASLPPQPPKKTLLQRACSAKQFAKLVACLGLDFFGNATYLLPGLGESGDLAYAPAQAVALKMLFDANGIMVLGLVEELLPFTDIMPTATLAWCLETFAPDSKFARLVGIHSD